MAPWQADGLYRKIGARPDTLADAVMMVAPPLFVVGHPNLLHPRTCCGCLARLESKACLSSCMAGNRCDAGSAFSVEQCSWIGAVLHPVAAGLVRDVLVGERATTMGQPRCGGGMCCPMFGACGCVWRQAHDGGKVCWLANLFMVY